MLIRVGHLRKVKKH